MLSASRPVTLSAGSSSTMARIPNDIQPPGFQALLCDQVRGITCALSGHRMRQPVNALDTDVPVRCHVDHDTEQERSTLELIAEFTRDRPGSVCREKLVELDWCFSGPVKFPASALLRCLKTWPRRQATCRNGRRYRPSDKWLSARELGVFRPYDRASDAVTRAVEDNPPVPQQFSGKAHRWSGRVRKFSCGTSCFAVPNVSA